ncbi:SLOG cluster 4 domain-containing protein [Burkholderia sp. Ac-20379]
MGSGKEAWPELAEPLGRWIAEQGFDLLTGAGRGVMLSTARAFSLAPNRRGRSIGIVPSEPHAEQGFAPLDGYPNPYVDLPVLTPLPRKVPGTPDGTLNRNYVNVLTSDVVVALPGSQGTLDEIRLAARFRKPLVCVGPSEAFAAVPPGVRVVPALADAFEFVLRQVAALADRNTPAGA